MSSAFNLVPVDGDPFAAPSPSPALASAVPSTVAPVAPAPPSGMSLVPVEHDPFAAPAPDAAGPAPVTADAAVPAPSWQDVPGQALANAPRSAVNLVQNVVQPFLHPQQTLETFDQLGTGLASKLLGVVGVPQDPAKKAQMEATANAVGQFFANRYGSVDNLKRTLANDPVGVLADAATVLTAGEGAAVRAPGIIGEVGRVAGTVGRAIDPITAATKVAGATGRAASLPLSVTTGVAPRNIVLAGRAGAEGNTVFRDQMRGVGDINQPIDLANSALKQMQGERAAAYNVGMTGVRNDPTQLNFTPINRAVQDARNEVRFNGVSKSDEADKVLDRIEDKVVEWQSQPPVTMPGPNGGTLVWPHATPLGLDALKQAVGEIRSTTEPGSIARRSADSIYNAVKSAIVKQAPDYAKTMGNYAEASDRLKELRKTFSLTENASRDTTLRKLQSIMRDNVNANYGARTKLGDELAQYEPDLPYALAGQTMSTPLPRGLAKYLAGGIGVGGVGALLTNPVAAIAAGSALAASSPRLVGEAAYLAGRGVRALRRTKPVSAARATYQAGRLPLGGIGLQPQP